MPLAPYLQLCRVSNLPTVWTNVLAGVLLSGVPLSPHLFLLPAFSLSCFYLAGMALNDLYDRHYDRDFRPSRPIPSGRVTPRAAAIVVGVLFGAGLAALAFAPHLEALPAALLLAAAIHIYDRHHKGNPFSVLIMASCRFLVYAVAALAVSGNLAPLVVTGAVVQFIYIVVLSVVARIENSRGGTVAASAMPFLLAGISLVDGIMLAFILAPSWLLAGAGGFALTLAGQRWVRGD